MTQRTNETTSDDDTIEQAEMIEVDGQSVPKSWYDKQRQTIYSNASKQTLKKVRNEFGEVAADIDGNAQVNDQISALKNKVADLTSAMANQAESQAKSTNQQELARMKSEMQKQMAEQQSQLATNTFANQVVAEATKLGLKDNYTTDFPSMINGRFDIAASNGSVAVTNRATGEDVIGDNGYKSPSELAKSMKEQLPDMFKKAHTAPGNLTTQNGTSQVPENPDWSKTGEGSSWTANRLIEAGFKNGELPLPEKPTNFI